ncbi:related to Vacuolar protein sorting-associated protein 3 [Zygosaccharomyces bailii]|nr:related to Vacuolar protein sorting-associated protein 3 [Zygosaccharomyces bailii]
MSDEEQLSSPLHPKRPDEAKEPKETEQPAEEHDREESKQVEEPNELPSSIPLSQQNQLEQSSETVDQGKENNSEVSPSSQGNESQESNENELEISKGPFEKHELIRFLPSNLEYTCFEAYDENVYLGTKTGDLLHYFEIERHNYMLVSQTKLDDELDHPITKIILLPHIERALVLCNSILVVFLLPEFAPAPNTPKFKGVADVTIRNYSSQFKCYKFYAMKEDSIKLLKISSHGINVAQTFDYKLVKKACSYHYTLMTAKLNNYEIINLRDSTVTPLFQISESEAPLKPIITKFNEGEFLVTTGGGSETDSSIVFVVNSDGEISHGTMVLDEYPEEVIVEYPYVLITFGSNRLEVYKVSPNSEPQVVQKMVLKNSPLGLCRTSKVFNNFERKTMRERVIDKLRLVPLLGINHSFRIDSETAYIDQIFEEKSSLAVYGKFGIDLLIKNSPVLEFDQYGEPEIDKLEEYLIETSKTTLSHLEQSERTFLETLLLLLVMLHCSIINEEYVKKWCSMADEIDIKLLFYLLDLSVHGDIWVCNGLVKFIERLKSLNLINKCSDIVKLLRFMKNELRASKIKNSTKNYSNLVLMIDVNILKVQLQGNDNDILVEDFEEHSLEEITAIVEERSHEHTELLLKIYQRRGMLQEIINLLKKKKDIDRIFEFLTNNAKNLPPTYKPEDLTEDLMFAIKEASQLNKSLVKEALKILSLAQVEPSELLNKTGNNTRIKVFIIEEVGARSPDDKEFLVNFYMAKLQETLQDGNIWDLFAAFAAEYTKDMNYTKCSIAEFLQIKLTHNKQCQSFVEFYQNIRDLCLHDQEDRLLRSVVSQVKSFDCNHMLTLLFLPEGQVREEFLTAHQAFEAYLSFNDFLGIEKYVTETNILEVLKHYNELPRGIDSLKLTKLLLKRNMHCIRGEGTLIAILTLLPCEYSFQPFFDVVYDILKRLDDEKRQLELQKAILKDENATFKTIYTTVSNE